MASRTRTISGPSRWATTLKKPRGVKSHTSGRSASRRAADASPGNGRAGPGLASARLREGGELHEFVAGHQARACHAILGEAQIAAQADAVVLAHAGSDDAIQKGRCGDGVGITPVERRFERVEGVALQRCLGDPSPAAEALNRLQPGCGATTTQ